MWRDKTGTIREPRTNQVSKRENRVLSLQKPAFFTCAIQKDFERRLFYFSRNITMTTLTYSKSTDQQHLCVKFLGDKKGPTKGFYLEASKIKWVFLCQVYLLNYQLRTVYISAKVCIYVCRMRLHKLKRDWNIILNSQFQKLKRFCQFFESYHKTYSKKSGGVDTCNTVNKIMTSNSSHYSCPRFVYFRSMVFLLVV